MEDKAKGLTAERKRSCLRRGGGCGCPYCGSDAITGGSVDIEGKGASQEVSCQECGKCWRDVYTLANVEEIA